VEDAGQVEPDDAVPLGQLELVDPAEVAAAGVVEQCTEPAQLGGGVADRVLERVVVVTSTP
jgi:hypothetical protein